MIVANAARASWATEAVINHHLLYVGHVIRIDRRIFCLVTVTFSLCRLYDTLAACATHCLWLKV